MARARTVFVLLAVIAVGAPIAESRVVRLDVERREIVLSGKPFGLAGPCYLAFPRTRQARIATGDPRESIEERYRDRDDYIGKITRAALDLVERRFLHTEDLPEIINRGVEHYEWATSH